jgi:hypothetical protein
MYRAYIRDLLVINGMHTLTSRNSHILTAISWEKY